MDKTCYTNHVVIFCIGLAVVLIKIDKEVNKS